MSFIRHPKNPILTPEPSHDWEDGAVFNPGATLYKGKFYVLYRAIGEYEQYVSSVGLAESSDGVNFTRKAYPALVPEETYEKYGIEDLRINSLEGSFYLTHTVLGCPATQGGEPHQIGLIKTYNFMEFKRLGVITPEVFCSRNGVLFPEKVGDNYVLLHRPLYLMQKGDFYPRKHGSLEGQQIWICYSKNLLEWDWTTQSLLLEPAFWWENYKVGAGPPPIKTQKGWLLIYHGVQETRQKSHIYRAGLALLDLNDPKKVLFRSKEPILQPEKKYELVGDTPNVVFPTGLVEKEGVLYLYYGAADKTVCLATASLQETLSSLC